MTRDFNRAFGSTTVALLLCAALSACAADSAGNEDPARCESSQATRPDSSKWSYDVLSGMSIPPDTQSKFPRLFENGSLKSWESLTNGSNVQANKDNLNSLLNSVDGDTDIRQRMIDAYDRGYTDGRTSAGCK